MPFWLMNAPSTFQRLMENCLGDLHLNQYIIYLDDIPFFQNSSETGTKIERSVWKAGTPWPQIESSKCELFQTKLHYLRLVVCQSGIEGDPKMIAAIDDWPIWKTVTDVQSFLGFTNYYSRFIHHYAWITSPLNTLISGENASKK